MASSFKNIEQVRKISNDLTVKGYVHTYDWTQNKKANSIEKLASVQKKKKQ